MESKDYKEEIENKLKPELPEPKPMVGAEIKTKPITELNNEIETEKKLEFIKKHNALVMEYGYDFLVRVLPPELIKVEFNK